MSGVHRRGAHLEFVGGKSPRQRIWEQLRKWQPISVASLSKLFSVADGVKPATVRTYVKSLEAGGWVRMSSGRVVLVRDNGVEAPRVRRDGSAVSMGRVQENVWRTLRTMHAGGPLTVVELAALASTRECLVAASAVASYVRQLERAGYVARLGERFRLAVNSGPRPPMVQRVKRLFDPNLGCVVWTSDAEEAGDE